MIIDPISLRPCVARMFTVNGRPTEVFVEATSTLLEVLRIELSMTGTKQGCDLGACGACTVVVDGRRIASCLALAASYEGSHITTIEGLGSSIVFIRCRKPSFATMRCNAGTAHRDRSCRELSFWPTIRSIGLRYAKP